MPAARSHMGLPSGPQGRLPHPRTGRRRPQRHFLYRKTNFLHRKANFLDSQIIRMRTIPPIPTGRPCETGKTTSFLRAPRPPPPPGREHDRRPAGPERGHDVGRTPACHPGRRFARPRASDTGNHRPAVHTTGLRMPASSTRPAQRHGPDGPPSCVRQIGTTHKDGGTVRPPEGKDDGRQEEHRMRRLRRAGGGGRSRAMRRLRQDPMRGLPVRMRRLPCHRMH